MRESREYELPWEYTLEIQKVKSSDGRRIIAGFASNGSLDGDGEVMDMTTLKMASDSYFKNGIVRFMHNKSPLFKGPIGKVIPEYTDEEGTVHKTSFNSKPYLVIEISKSPAVDHIWTMIQEGLYRGLSIGGKLLKRVSEFSKEAGKNVNKILVKSWLETSIVDVPAAKGSFFNVLKGISMGDLEETENNEELNMEKEEGVLKAILDRMDSIEKRITDKEQVEEQKRLDAINETVAKQAQTIEELEKKLSEGKTEEDFESEVEKRVNEKMTPVLEKLEKLEKSPMFRGTDDGDFNKKKGDEDGEMTDEDFVKMASGNIIETVLMGTYFSKESEL